MIRIRSMIIVLCLAAAAPVAAGGASFDDDFENATLRVDFYQYGDKAAQFMAVDRLIRQGAWAGPVRHLIDPLPYGIYVARLTDKDDGRVLFEQGFDSFFGEYRTTAPAARGVVRVFNESVLVPFPRRTAIFSLGERPPGGEERTLVEIEVDPDSVDIAHDRPAPGAVVVSSHVVGEPHHCLDIAFIGEGYTAAEIDTFTADVERFSELMLSQEPYASRSDRINIRGVLLPSAESGVDEPTRGVWRSTSIGASFNSFSSPRYLLTDDSRALRDVAANVPYDTLLIMVNHERYGGGGLYNRFCTFTAHGPVAGYLLLHEFGHSFGGLADEYYTSSTAYDNFYPEGHEPAAPNITAEVDPDAIKWADLLTEGVDLPVAWDKEAYDEADLAYQAHRRELNADIAEATRSGAPAAEIEALEQAELDHSLERMAEVEAFMKGSGQTDLIGAFEGAGYVSEGLYRPQIDCIMFTRGVKPYCSVCRRAVNARINVYTGDPLPPAMVAVR